MSSLAPRERLFGVQPIVACFGTNEHQHAQNQSKLVGRQVSSKMSSSIIKTLNIRTSRITILFCLADDVNVDFRDVDNWKLFNFIITFVFWIRRDIDG